MVRGIASWKPTVLIVVDAVPTRKLAGGVVLGFVHPSGSTVTSRSPWKAVIARLPSIKRVLDKRHNKCIYI